MGCRGSESLDALQVLGLNVSQRAVREFDHAATRGERLANRAALAYRSVGIPEYANFVADLESLFIHPASLPCPVGLLWLPTFENDLLAALRAVDPLRAVWSAAVVRAVPLFHVDWKILDFYA